MLSSDNKRLLASQIALGAVILGLVIYLAPDTHAQVQLPILEQPIRNERNNGVISFGMNQRLGLFENDTYISAIEGAFSYDDDVGTASFVGQLACFDNSDYTEIDFVEISQVTPTFNLENRDFPVRVLFDETVKIPAGKYCLIGIAGNDTSGLTGEIFALGTDENIYQGGEAIFSNRATVEDYFFSLYSGEPTDEQAFFTSRIKGFTPQGTTTASTTVVMQAEYFFNSAVDFGIFDSILFDVQNLETSYQYAPIIRPITTSGDGVAIATTTLDIGVHGVVVTFYDSVLGNKGDSRYFEFTVIETETVEASDPVSKIIRNLFMPSQSSLNRLTSLGSIVKDKPPLGYFFEIRDFLSGVSTTTADFQLQSTDGIKQYIFDPLRAVISTIIGFASAIFVFNRIKKIKL